MEIELTEAQVNALRYAAEYKLEQDPNGDGISSETDRQVMIRAVAKLREALKLGPSRFA